VSVETALVADLNDAHAIATTGTRDDGPNPCDACLDGDGPAKCVAVSCWRCDCGCRERRHGTATHAPEGPQQGARSNLRTERR
jgi:hypothetical protein